MMAKSGQAVYLQDEHFQLNFSLWMKRFVFVAGFVGVLFWALHVMDTRQVLPISKVRFHGEFINVNESMLHKALDGVVSGGYFNVDVEKVRVAIESMPWVYQASVRRVWPNTLSIKVEEQKAIAVLKAKGLVNEQGEIFSPDTKSYPVGIPVFEGPEYLAKNIMEQYSLIQNIFAGLGLTVTHLTMDARHSLLIRLSNEMELDVGRYAYEERFKRFSMIYKEHLFKHEKNIKRIDLRYTNGMAIRWK